MTLSEQTNNTTSNTPHVARHSDFPFPPPPAFLGRSLSFLLSAPFACFSFAPLALSGGALLLRLGSFLWLLRVLHALFLRGPIHLMLFLPPSVPFVFLRSLWGFALLGSWVFCLLFPSVCLLFSAVSVVLLRGCGRVPLFLAWCLALVGSPPCLLLPPLPPRLVPCGALVQFHAGTSLWVSGCSCDGSVALPLC